MPLTPDPAAELRARIAAADAEARKTGGRYTQADAARDLGRDPRTVRGWLASADAKNKHRPSETDMRLARLVIVEAENNLKKLEKTS